MSVHSGLFVSKMFNGKVKLKEDEAFAVQLECGHIITLCGFKPEEIEAQKIYCPINKTLKEVDVWRKVKLEPEILADKNAEVEK